MCKRAFSQRCSMLRHVRIAHSGKWTCSIWQVSFSCEENFRYHTRTCDFKATGVKRSAPEQVGGGKKTRCTPLPKDTVEMSIDLTKVDQVGDNKYEALSSGMYAFKPILLEWFHKGAVRFYLSLHTKFSTFPHTSY